MNPIFFKLVSGVSLIIVPENNEGHINTFQLYHGSRSNFGKSLNNLNNYSGLISFDEDNQKFYYTPGNFLFTAIEILEIVAFIKTKI
jgi:hypothetical protein